MRSWISVTLGAVMFAAVHVPTARAQGGQNAMMAPSAADEAAIKQDIDNLVTAFNKKDGQGWGAAFAEDGNQNNLRGLNNASGREMISANYARGFQAGALKAAQDTVVLRPIHMLSDTVAVVDADVIGGVGNDHDLWPLVMVKRNGQWLIYNFHEYAVGEK